MSIEVKPDEVQESIKEAIAIGRQNATLEEQLRIISLLHEKARVCGSLALASIYVELATEIAKPPAPGGRLTVNASAE